MPRSTDEKKSSRKTVGCCSVSSSAKTESNKKLRIKLELADRDKLKNISRPKRDVKKYTSYVDKELARDSRATWRWKQKQKRKQFTEEVVHESGSPPKAPKRRSKRSISHNRSSVAALQEINKQFEWRDTNTGAVKLRFWKGVVPRALLSGAVSSTRAVMRELIEKNEELKRKGADAEKLRDNTLHFGTWPDYQPYFYITQQTRVVPRAVSFLENKNNRKLINWLTEHFRKNFNKTYEQYCNLKLPDVMRLIGRAFPTMAINYGTASPHYDVQDKKDGVAYLINYGDFEGGELVFRDLNLKFKFEPGDLIAFDGRSLYHENLPARGERYSMVLFGHQSCFTK